MENYELQCEITALKEIIIRLEKQITQEKSYNDYLAGQVKKLKDELNSKEESKGE